MNTNTELNVSNLIKPLSQNDLAGGWRLVVPRVKRIAKTYKDETTGETVTKQGYNIYRVKVNMAQLPYHLWKRVHTTRNGMVRVNDKSHHYIVNPTNVDSEIRELVTLLNEPYDSLYREQVINLVNVLSDNKVYGWPIIAANKKYNITC
jgi:hypothetical protein